MPHLELVRDDHAAAILGFEHENRGYFARFITDRGDDYFAEFPARHAALLAEQAAGDRASYVFVDDDDGSILGRFNLYDIGDGEADVGYRMAERSAGRGLATEALRELCTIAAKTHGLSALTAAVGVENVGSRRVLAKAGFRETGPVDPSTIGGDTGSGFRRDLDPA